MRQMHGCDRIPRNSQAQIVVLALKRKMVAFIWSVSDVAASELDQIICAQIHNLLTASCHRPELSL